MKFILLVVLLFVSLATFHQVYGQQQEVFLGDIIPRSHGVSGKVYALDDQTIVIRELFYDGMGPDAYFWYGIRANEKPNNLGSVIPDENGSTKPLKGYRNATVTLRLPPGRSLRNIKTFGLWCRAFQENFGHINVNYS